MAGYRPSFRKQEELYIVNYIINHNAFSKVKGNTLWKALAEEMKKEKLCERSFESIKNHYKRKILEQLLHYNLSDVDILRFRATKCDVQTMNQRLKKLEITNAPTVSNQNSGEQRTETNVQQTQEKPELSSAQSDEADFCLNCYGYKLSFMHDNYWRCNKCRKVYLVTDDGIFLQKEM